MLSTHNYVTQGGAAVVVYRAGDTSVEDGVQAGRVVLPRAPAPGGRARGPFLSLRRALGPRRRDADPSDRRRTTCATAPRLGFVDRFFPKPPARDTIRLSDSFMARVVPEILRQTPDLGDRGDLLENYLQVNRDLRQTQRRGARGSRRELGPGLPLEPALPALPQRPGDVGVRRPADLRLRGTRGRPADPPRLRPRLHRPVAGTRRQPGRRCFSRATSGSTGTRWCSTTATGS